MLKDRVKCAVANPGGPIGVGSTITLGAAPVGFRTFLTAFGSAQPAYFVLSDGAGKALGGIWTVNGDGTATITSILINDATGGTGSETFSSACTAWCALPAAGVGGQLIAAATAAAARAVISAQPISTATSGAVGEKRFVNSGSGSSLVLPSGGTWEYDVRGVTGTGTHSGDYFVGVAAGGSTVSAGIPGVAILGSAKRIL